MESERHNISFERPLLSPSQFSFILGLVRMPYVFKKNCLSETGVARIIHPLYCVDKEDVIVLVTVFIGFYCSEGPYLIHMLKC